MAENWAMHLGKPHEKYLRRVLVRAGTQGPLLAYFMLHPGYFYIVYKTFRANQPCGPC